MNPTWKPQNLEELDKIIHFDTDGDGVHQFFFRRVTDIEECKNLMRAHVTTHPVVQALGFEQDEESMQSLLGLLEIYLNLNMSCGCFLRQGEQETLVALDIMYVRNYADLPINQNDFPGEAMAWLLKYIRRLEREVRYPQAEKKCNFLTSFGVIIAPEFMQFNFETKFLRRRELFAEALGINIIGLAFISQGNIPKNYTKITSFTEEDLRELNLISINFNIVIMYVLICGPRPCRPRRQKRRRRLFNQRQVGERLNPY